MYCRSLVDTALVLCGILNKNKFLRTSCSTSKLIVKRFAVLVRNTECNGAIYMDSESPSLENRFVGCMLGQA
jgi:hypothetical protein